MKKSWIWVISILVFLVILAVTVVILNNICIGNCHAEPICMGGGPNTVMKIIDGDTFEYYDEDMNYKTVRLLCVDTPEKGEEGYEEAKRFLEQLLLCEEIILKHSDYSNDTDKYGRLLRWIYINNSELIYEPDNFYPNFPYYYYTNYSKGEVLFVNKAIIDLGYGDVLIIPPETCSDVKA